MMIHMFSSNSHISGLKLWGHSVNHLRSSSFETMLRFPPSSGPASLCYEFPVKYLFDHCLHEAHFVHLPQGAGAINVIKSFRLSLISIFPYTVCSFLRCGAWSTAVHLGKEKMSLQNEWVGEQHRGAGKKWDQNTVLVR